MSAANKKFRQLDSKVHAWKSSDYQRDKQTEEPIKTAEITTAEVTCPSCGFKARYKFLRCPECNALRKEEKDGITKEENQDSNTKI